MTKPKNRSVDKKNSAGDQILYKTSETLIQSGARPAAKPLLRLLRFFRRDRIAASETVKKTNPARPTGPYATDDECALLNFVPRDIKSRLIDDATGGYGYSHTAVDVGEKDLLTGKHTMIESTLFDVVHRSFQDAYGDRKFVRIPLKLTGVDCQKFHECVKSKLGEKYDNEEALTWGRVDDPAKQVCSDLAADCLPESMRHDIAEKHTLGLFKRHAVSVHHHRDGSLGVFVSPNGFSQYFGAPRGEDLEKKGQAIRPLPESKRPKKVITAPLPATLLTFGTILAAVCGVFISWILLRKRA